MSERERYPAGVPCWVETLQPDPRAAMDFYGPVFGWEFVGPGSMPSDPPGEYFAARLRGRDVAGIGSVPDASASFPTAWSTHVRVDSADTAAELVKDGGGAVLAGPFDALPAGRVAVVSDPAGATFSLWEARNREGAQLVNEPGAWAMSMLQTTDPEDAKAFYGTVFGWGAEPFGPPEAGVFLFRLPGFVGGEPQQPVARDVVAVMAGTSRSGSPDVPPPHWSVDFWVSETDATAARAAELGAAVIAAPHDAPGFRRAVIADPQGAVFSISALTG